MAINGITDAEIDYLARLVAPGVEAGHDYTPEERRALATVVLNRLRTGEFGRTLRGVMEAPNQFEPVWSKRFGAGGDVSKLPSRSPEEVAEVRRWVDDYVSGRGIDPTGGALFFQNVDETNRRGTNFARNTPHTLVVGRGPHQTHFYTKMDDTPAAVAARQEAALRSAPVGYAPPQPPATSTGLGWEYWGAAEDMNRGLSGEGAKAAPAPLPGTVAGVGAAPPAEPVVNPVLPAPSRELVGAFNPDGFSPVSTGVSGEAGIGASPMASLATALKALSSIGAPTEAPSVPSLSMPRPQPPDWMPQPSPRQGVVPQVPMLDPVLMALAGKLGQLVPRV